MTDRMQQHLKRRHFLRGTSVALALPWLPSFRTGFARAADGVANTGQPPVRMAFLYFPNGAWMKAWEPEQTGRDYELPFSLTPLEPVKSDVLVLTGLDKKHSRRGDGHYAKTANFLTGLPVVKTTGKDVSSGGISVDQLAAQHVGDLTPLPSLELATEPVITGIDSNVGFTRLYGSHISWQSAGRPLAREINPRIVYERLFGQQGVAEPRKSREFRNLLDFVLEDARNLRGKLSRDDQFKMDEYLDSVRAVEKRIAYYSRQDARQWNPEVPEEAVAQAFPGTPNQFQEHIAIMFDLLVLAFRTDSTRIATMMLANDVSGRNFSFLEGVSGGHHQLSHHENRAENIEQYQRITRWHVEQFARLLKNLKEIPEGEGTLLDHCMIMFGSSMSDGNRHDPDNLPILLGGRGGNTIDSGQHIHSEGEVPLCNLYLSMLDRMGVQVDSFGDSTARLTAIDKA